MKVLIVHPHLTNLGGAEIVVLKLSESLTKIGTKNSVLTLSLSKEVKGISNNIDFILPKKQYICMPKSVGFISATRVINEAVLLAWLIKKFESSYDVINVHNFPAHWGVFFSRAKKPVIWTCNEVPDIWHNPNPSIGLRLIRNIGVLFDRYIVNKCVNVLCSADTVNAEMPMGRYGRVPEIIPYGIDYEFFSQNNGDDSIARRYGLEDKFVILQAGLITPEKNQLASIQAVESLCKEILNIRLVLAGRAIGGYIDILKKYISEKRLNEFIIFTGNLDKLTLRSIYYISDVVIFPVKIQGGWLAPFEALCCGKPIIVSTTMGASDVIRKDNLGIISDNLTGAINLVHQDIQKYNKIARYAKEWVGKNLTYDIYARRMNRIYFNCYKK